MSSDRDPVSGADASRSQAGEPTEEELRAAYEAQVKQLRVEHLLLENVVTLANLGMRRTGLSPGTEDERDPEQVRLAIETIRALLPLLEQTAPQQAGAIREALSQLQLAFIRIGGQSHAPASGEPSAERSPDPATGSDEAPGQPQGEPGERGPGPAQRSGRLWVPGE